MYKLYVQKTRWKRMKGQKHPNGSTMMEVGVWTGLGKRMSEGHFRLSGLDMEEGEWTQQTKDAEDLAAE